MATKRHRGSEKPVSSEAAPKKQKTLDGYCTKKSDQDTDNSELKQINTEREKNESSQEMDEDSQKSNLVNDNTNVEHSSVSDKNKTTDLTEMHSEGENKILSDKKDKTSKPSHKHQKKHKKEKKKHSHKSESDRSKCDKRREDTYGSDSNSDDSHDSDHSERLKGREKAKQGKETSKHHTACDKLKTEDKHKSPDKKKRDLSKEGRNPPSSSRKEVAIPAYVKENFVFFFGMASPFSQFHQVKFKVDNIEYSCAEQYMMHQKAVLFKDTNIARQIMSETKPLKMKRLGRKVQNFNPMIWGGKCEDIVKEGNIAKFSQNPSLEQKLLETYPKTLAESSPRDCLWGIGWGASNPKAWNTHTWRGKNLLGKTLMKVRDILMKNKGLLKK